MENRTFDIRVITSPTMNDKVVTDILSSMEQKGYECIKKGSQKSRKDNNVLTYLTFLNPKDESELTQAYFDANTEEF
jgi:hypothetical protein